MHALVIGGNRFLGVELGRRLLARGDRVTLLNRGNLRDPLGDHPMVERLVADRGTSAFDAALAHRAFDVVVDLAAFTRAHVERAARVLGGRVAHYVLVSSGQVYLVREGCPRPSREVDYEGALMPAPRAPRDLDEWEYGVGKRDAEDALARAGRDGAFAETRLRIPMVNGERDHHRRLESYVARLLDGGPLLLPDGGHEIARHVYGGAVVRATLDLLGDARAFGRAFNLAQDETPTVRELVGLVARELGATAELVDVPRAEIERAGLDPRRASPFSSTWMSLVDPTLAKRELGFAHPPLDAYLRTIVASSLAKDALAGGFDAAERRAEIDLAERIARRGASALDAEGASSEHSPR